MTETWTETLLIVFVTVSILLTILSIGVTISNNKLINTYKKIKAYDDAYWQYVLEGYEKEIEKLREELDEEIELSIKFEERWRNLKNSIDNPSE